MIRVLHVIPAVAPRYGGPSAATIGMCRALAAAGVAPLVATTDADGDGRLAVTLRETVSYRDVPTIFFKRQGGEGFKWSRDLAAWLTERVSDFDVVHIHAVFSHSSLAAGRACQTAGVPYLIRPLGTLDPWSVGRKTLRKRALLTLGLRKVLRLARLMHYTTTEERRLAECSVRQLPQGVVIPLGVDDPKTSSRSRRSSKPSRMILSLSRLDEKKGLDLLIGAFHALDAPSWRLIIAGDGAPEYVRHLKNLASAGASAQHIEFVGWLDGDRKQELLSEADLFALPSHQENFGVGLVEAMAAGVPSIVTPGVNLAPDIVSSEAGWVAPRDPREFLKVLKKATSEESERLRRGRQARVFAERFRWPLVAEQLRAVYAEVIGSRTEDSSATAPSGRVA